MTNDEREKIKFYGYDDKIKPIRPSKDKIRFQNYLANILEEFSLRRETLDLTAAEVVESSKNFFEQFFTIQEILLVPVENDARFTHLAKNVTDPRRAKRIIKRFTIRTSPFDIPVVDGRITGVRSYLLDQVEHKGLRLKRYPYKTNDGIIYKNISVKKEKSITTPFEYTHEITHTQVDAHLGSVRDYFNCEVLSIFMEKLHAYYTGSKEFLTIERQRLSSLSKTLSYYNQFPCNLEDYAYIESTIEAEILFNLFISSSWMQTYILEYIQKIFAGYGNLEDLLDSLDITTNGLKKYGAIESNLSR